MSDLEKEKKGLIGLGQHQRKIAFILKTKKNPMTILELAAEVFGHQIKNKSSEYRSLAQSLEMMRKKELAKSTKMEIKWSLTELGEKI